MSQYLLKVIDTKTGGTAASWRPGHICETDMVEDLCRRLKAEGVGVLKTEAKVLAAVRKCWTEVLRELKYKV